MTAPAREVRVARLSKVTREAVASDSETIRLMIPTENWLEAITRRVLGGRMITDEEIQKLREIATESTADLTTQSAVESIIMLIDDFVSLRNIADSAIATLDAIPDQESYAKTLHRLVHGRPHETDGVTTL